ncbi:hypothetical protein TrLO_g13874, partial [Triparma laevis f. longispina]
RKLSGGTLTVEAGAVKGLVESSGLHDEDERGGEKEEELTGVNILDGVGGGEKVWGEVEEKVETASSDTIVVKKKGLVRQNVMGGIGMAAGLGVKRFIVVELNGSVLNLKIYDDESRSKAPKAEVLLDKTLICRPSQHSKVGFVVGTSSQKELFFNTSDAAERDAWMIFLQTLIIAE